MDKKLVLNFDPSTIEHLGISLYSKLPSVLSELVSNSWDADADKVTIDFIHKDSTKEILYKDNGEGMTFDELNEKYLVIGRNRRKDLDKKLLTAKNRKVIGKKGLGKLSVFGICDTIEVISVKNGLKNHFLMDLAAIKSSSKHLYEPELIAVDQTTQESSGTILKLTKVRRKADFNLEEISVSLSKKFLILDQMEVKIYHNGENETLVTNELKYSDINVEFEWTFPDVKFDSDYEYWSSIKGKVITLTTPVKDTEMRGIYLTSRGKIVNTASFYGARDNDLFHNYVTGYLEIDFIDDFDDDVISTDRHSLNWEHEETKKLQDYLHKIIKLIGKEWREKRSKNKRELILEEQSLNISDWQQSLPTYERELSNKIIDPILDNANIDVQESSRIIGNVINKFENQTFKEYASKIADISKPEDIPNLLLLMEDWKAIEAKQFKDLAYSRIEVIKQFENYISTNTNEVPTLHNFLKKFSWLLDPRILEFKDEVTYSTLLKETFPETELDDKNRRIDFLCSNALGEILYVIEIKRSLYKVDEKALEQAYHYQAFLENRFASQSGFSRVVCYVVGGEKSDDYKFKSKEKTYIASGQVFVKTYRELLEQSKEYHKEFIEAYDHFKER
ncbi:Histidine kinase-, DNA gyrase B-, and HSP90-like ATPase [Pseudarcicella hirudinis]|uniref:Histidine kinase-, DNA gyrase B-, and HSP90-like ATPase n=1 Tax=Pseudarcicella hirudinis TaxID=1079859 RepID=A0A1I5TWM9_9BACT|nr:ATP-binding protein [Pseudarcicella hirudinis]SFP87492.1 Histidine kinase-, DNA gyrase B-, and HSP90-like ATPase [Pseudarcicella hirudinis]